jgi:hypothetical protein
VISTHEFYVTLAAAITGVALQFYHRYSLRNFQEIFMCASTPSQSQHALNIRTHLSKITPLLSDRKQLLETADKIYRYLAEEKISIELMKNKESRVLIPSLDQMIRIISESCVSA